MDHTNENERYQKYMNLVKEINVTDFAPPHYIQESPFQWIQTIKNESLASSDYHAKLHDYFNQGDSYTFEKFIPDLALAFEYTLLGEFGEAKSFLSRLEDKLCTMQRNNDCFYSRIKPALEHVFLATKTNIFILGKENSEEVNDLKEKCYSLKPVSEMDSVQQAAIHAIKAKFYLSCTKETGLALTYMKEAASLDPSCATWKYWTGKILRKIRRDEKGFEPTEELKYFEEAVQLDRDAKHLVFLAQVYREKSNYMFKKKIFFKNPNDDISREVDSLNEKSCELYMESVKLNPTSAAICRRAGNGLMSLPKQYAKYRLAKAFLHKAEELSENPVTFHILGTFYMRYEKNPDKAIEYFQKTADNRMAYGFHELLKMKYVVVPDYDPVEDLTKAAKILECCSTVEKMEGDLGWWYMILQNNVFKGLEYFWKIIERDENSSLLKRFYSYTFVVRGPLNIYRILNEKILSVEEDLRDDLMIKFLEKVNANPKLLEDSDGCVSLKKALSEASATLKWERINQKRNKIEQFSKTGVPDKFGETRYTRMHKSEIRKKPASDNRAPPKQENWRLECRKF